MGCVVLQSPRLALTTPRPCRPLHTVHARVCDTADGSSTVAVAAMRMLLAAGAVADTWAPSGSSALMLAAAADGVPALQVRLSCSDAPAAEVDTRV